MKGKTATSVTSRKLRLTKILGEVRGRNNGKLPRSEKLNRIDAPHKFTKRHELLPGKKIQVDPGPRHAPALAMPRPSPCPSRGHSLTGTIPTPSLGASLLPQPRQFASSPALPAIEHGHSRLARLVAAVLVTGLMASVFASFAAADPRATKQQEAFVRFITLRGADPATEKLAALFRELQPDGPRYARQLAAFERLREPDFAVRETAMRFLIAEPWIPPALLRDFLNAPEAEVRWRARRVQQVAGAAQEHFARIAARVLGANPVPGAAAAPGAAGVAGVAGTPGNAGVAGMPETKAVVEPRSPYARLPLAERTLIATGTRGVALELDGDGKELWRVPFRAWSAERLASGATLLASVEEQSVVEIDREGKVLWRYGPVAATRAKPLANGNVLVVDYPGGRVLELGRDQAIRWQHAVDEPCFDAERLDNGHTLVATANLIQEIAFDGVTVWQWQVRGRLNGLQALADGRILVANYGANEIAELDNDGRVARRIEEPQPSDAFRLPNGHTLVATATRIVEFNAAGELHRVLATARYGSARR